MMIGLRLGGVHRGDQCKSIDEVCHGYLYAYLWVFSQRHWRLCLHWRRYTVLEDMRRFTQAVIDVFRPEYLREPNEEDTERLLGEREERGWHAGMLESIEESSSWMEMSIQRPLQGSNSRSWGWSRLVSGDAPPCNYVANGHDYMLAYYLSMASIQYSHICEDNPASSNTQEISLHSVLRVG
jgi:hypothetical protein